MNIDLVDDYVLTTDPYNFILNQKQVIEKGDNKGQEHLVIIGFYPSIVGALQGLVSKKMKASRCKTARTLLEEHTALTERLEVIFKALEGRTHETG